MAKVKKIDFNLFQNPSTILTQTDKSLNQESAKSLYRYEYTIDTDEGNTERYKGHDQQ
jgi:hypothetical protein